MKQLVQISFTGDGGHQLWFECDYDLNLLLDTREKIISYFSDKKSVPCVYYDASENAKYLCKGTYKYNGGSVMPDVLYPAPVNGAWLTSSNAIEIKNYLL